MAGASIVHLINCWGQLQAYVSQKGLISGTLTVVRLGLHQEPEPTADSYVVAGTRTGNVHSHRVGVNQGSA